MAKISRSTGRYWEDDAWDRYFDCGACGKNDCKETYSFCPHCGEPIEWVE